MKLMLLRHATLVVETAGTRILVDPCLGKSGSLDPVRCRVLGHDFRNPLVDLPREEQSLHELMRSIDLSSSDLSALIVWHLGAKG